MTDTAAIGAHTPTPWKVVNDGWTPWEGAIEVRGQGIEPDSTICWTPSEPNADENAAFIVRAVNAYDTHRELIATLCRALEPFAKYAGDPNHIKQRAFLQLLICPLSDEHPDNHIPFFQAARRALSLARATLSEKGDE